MSQPICLPSLNCNQLPKRCAMKKNEHVRLLAAVAVLSVALAGSAEAQFKIGVIGGVNFATVDDVNVGSVSETFDNRSGFHVGAFVELGTSGFAVRPGALYLNAGSLFNEASFLDPNLDEFSMSFVAFPIDFRARIGILDLFVGPEFQLLVSADAESDFDDDLKSWVVNGGAGVGLRLGPFLPEVRYLFGLSSLTESDFTVGGVTVTTDGPRTQALRASVGLAF